jgi:hypothetical protein
MGNRDTHPTRHSVSSPGRSWRDTSARPSRAEPWESSVVEDVAYTDVEQAQQAREAQASKVSADRISDADLVDDPSRVLRQSRAAGDRATQVHISSEFSDGSPPSQPQASPVPPHRLQDDEYVEPVVNTKPAFGRNSLIALAAATALGVMLVSLDVWRTRADATLAITQSTSGMASASAVPAVAAPPVTTVASRSDAPTVASAPASEGVSREKAPTLAPGIAAPITIITSSTSAPGAPEVASSVGPAATPNSGTVSADGPAMLPTEQPPMPQAEGSSEPKPVAAKRTQRNTKPAQATGATPSNVDEARLKQALEWLERRGPRP